MMVRAAGFEPAATGSQSRSATAAPRPELKTLPCIGLHCLAIPLRATLCRALPRLSLHGKALLLKAFPLPLPPLSGGGVESETLEFVFQKREQQKANPADEKKIRSDGKKRTGEIDSDSTYAASQCPNDPCTVAHYSIPYSRREMPSIWATSLSTVTSSGETSPSASAMVMMVLKTR